MRTISPRSLKKRAATMTKDASDFRKVVLLHGAVSLGAALAVFLLSLLVDALAPNQGGLDGLRTAAIYSTIQSTLETVYSILLPFWQIGVLYAAIRLTRRQSVEFSDLTQGFRRWGVLLRYYILLYVGVMAVIMAVVSIFSILIGFLLPIHEMIVPLPESIQLFSSEAYLTELQTAVDAGDMAAMAKLIPMDLVLYMIPEAILILVGCLGVMLHLYYRIRLSQYILLDDPAVRARGSILISNQMVKGNKWKLFLLDLSFWWYGLLGIIPVAVTWLPLILTLCNVSLPISGTVLSLICHIVSTGISLALLWFFGYRVQAAYACAYDELRTPPQTIVTQDEYMPR